MIQRASKATEK